jgi:hypothetical protein
MKIDLSGRLTAICVASNHDPDSFEATPKTSVHVTMEGIEGDRHSGLTRPSDVRTPHYPRGTTIRNSRQISIVSVEELATVAAAMGLPTILPQWLLANLAFEGIPDLTAVPPSTRLFFPQETVLVVEGENMPCIYPGKEIQRHYPEIRDLATAFPKAAIHRRGLVAWVERPGVIYEGDTVGLALPRQVLYSLASVS